MSDFGSTSAALELEEAVAQLGRGAAKFRTKYRALIVNWHELLKIDDPARSISMRLLREDYLAEMLKLGWADGFYPVVENVTKHRLRQFSEQGRIMERLRDKNVTDQNVANELREMRRDWDRRHREQGG